MEGAAILSAVLAVATVTATNDYSKDQQFRALNAIKEDIHITVRLRAASQQADTGIFSLCAGTQAVVVSHCHWSRRCVATTR